MRLTHRLGALCLVALFAIGCGSNAPHGEMAKMGPDRSEARDKDKKDGHVAVSDPAPTPPAPAAGMEVAMNGTDRPEPRSPRLPQSGILTAGSFDDSREPAAFQNFLRLIGQKSDLVNLPVRFNTRPMVVTVQDGEGRPVGNAKVRVNQSVELTTRSDGRVLLVPAWDRLPVGQELTLSVTPPDDGAVVTQRVPRGADRVQVTLSVQARTPRISIWPSFWTPPAAWGTRSPSCRARSSRSRPR